MRVVVSDVPVAFEPLLKPARYKGAYGGRGGAKSHFFADRLVLRALVEPIRAVCIREVQQSLRDSSRQLVVDKIQAHNIGDRFDVLDAEIRGRNGSIVIFRGMQSYNAETIKSLEGYDIAWTEEAQTLSGKSLKMLRPTLREKGSELWFSWNPRHRTDPVDEFFRGKSPHPEAVSVPVNWRDNPWFPDELRRDMEYDKASDPEDAEHVWEGAYGVSQGSILGRWVDAADRDGRINDDVQFDPESAIELSADIGFHDTAAFWFWQRRVGGFAVLDYIGDNGLDADDWIEILQQRLTERGWPIGKIWLPHDARAKTFQSKHTVVSRFTEAFGNKVYVVPQSKKMDQINAARRVLPKCEFHRSRCGEGLDGLRAWEFEFNEDEQVFSKNPLHNWASHPADAFAYGSQVMDEQRAPEAPKPEPVIKTISIGVPSTVTLEELWEDEALQQSKRLRGWV